MSAQPDVPGTHGGAPPTVAVLALQVSGAAPTRQSTYTGAEALRAEPSCAVTVTVKALHAVLVTDA